MKNLFYFFAFILVLASCNKWKDDSYNNLVYYTEDFKEKDFKILNIASQEIDALWFEIYSTDKTKNYNKYALIVKSNGECFKEIGSFQTDWVSQITFTPNNGNSFPGKWISGKEKFTISSGKDERIEELTFIYKETGKHCKKGK